MPNAEWRINDEARMTEILSAATSSFVILIFIHHSSFGFRHCNDHAFATITQIRMLLARADGWAMAPAAGTLFVGRFRHRSAGFFRLMNRQITDDEKLFLLFFTDYFCDLGVRP